VGRVAVAAVVVLVSGCGVVDRAGYVRENERLLASLPTYPGAQPILQESTPDYDTADGERLSLLPRAYTTRVIYRLPPGTRDAAVFAFYRRALRGWHAHIGEPSVIVEVSKSGEFQFRRAEVDAISFSRGSESVVVNSVRGPRIAVFVDHG